MMINEEKNQKDYQVRTLCIMRQISPYKTYCEVQRCQMLLRKGFERGKNADEWLLKYLLKFVITG